MMYEREIKLKNLKGSAFLFGPRMTGKSFLLKREFERCPYFDLLNPENELKYRHSPALFWEEISKLKPQSLVVVDEVQRVPSLLDYAQLGMEDRGLRFILSGSSARKLRRGGANLLGGRARDLKLHPLTRHELGPHFNLQQVIRFGSLPKVLSLLTQREDEEAIAILQSYKTTYLTQEIQMEALVRKLDAFQRFLDVAAQSNAQIIEFANISRECSVHMSTVKEFYQILEDTLIGRFLWPWMRSEHKKARPKFYFFDTGVVRSLQEQLKARPTANETRFLFETWFVNELYRIRDYGGKEHQISLWREDKHEIDVIIESGKKMLFAFECKSGKTIENQASIQAFRRKFSQVPLVIVSAQDERKRSLPGGLEIWPATDAVEYYRNEIG